MGDQLCLLDLIKHCWVTQLKGAAFLVREVQGYVHSSNVVYHIYLYAYAKSSLPFRDKSHLFKVRNPFILLTFLHVYLSVILVYSFLSVLIGL